LKTRTLSAGFPPGPDCTPLDRLRYHVWYCRLPDHGGFRAQELLAHA
jgi:hypothetical protein